MQSTTRPSHHANSSRSLFQNPWMVADSTAAPPPHASRSTPRKSTSNYWPGFPAGFQLPTLERVPASVPAQHLRPPVKVVKPDWGITHHSTATDSSSDTVPNLKATWLGHSGFIVEFPRVAADSQDEPPRVLFDPIFSECAGPFPWVGIRRRLPPPCTVAELPEFQFVVYSHNHYDHLDLPTLQQIHELRGEHVHFLVPLGNKTLFEETGIPASQVTELDWWDHVTLPTQPGSDQELKFVCTPAQHKSGRGFMDAWTTLWASWVVEQALPGTTGSDRASVYFSGDTGYMTTSGPCPIFEEIGSKYGPFDIAMLSIWRGGTLSFIARLGFRLIHTHSSLLASFHATPSQAVRMHDALRARHSLAMHFATFAGSDVEAFDPIVELEQAKREMGGEGEEGKVIGAQTVGDWWMEGGMGVIDVGETAVVRVRKTSPRLSEGPRRAVER